MKSFPHPNMEGFRCPICSTKADAPVLLIGVPGTEDGGIMEAKQVHEACYIVVRGMFELEQSQRRIDHHD